MKKHAAPIIAATLILLPVLYVGSYLALVKPAGPSGTFVMSLTVTYPGDRDYPFDDEPNYRSKGEWESQFFWPLEQIDRKLRPRAWHMNFSEGR